MVPIFYSVRMNTKRSEESNSVDGDTLTFNQRWLHAMTFLTEHKEEKSIFQGFCN